MARRAPGTAPDRVYPVSSPESIRRIHTARMKNTDPYAATRRAFARFMVNERDTQADALRQSEIRSDVRKYKAPLEDQQHFVWSRSVKLDPHHEEIMKESVDLYLENMKNKYCARGFTPKTMRDSEVPYSARKAGVRVLNTAKGIREAFADSDYYEKGLPKLDAKLPDLPITHRFKQFIRETGDVMPEVLQECPVYVAPPDPRIEIRKQRRQPLFADPIYNGMK